ncbi:MAG TPA: NAD(P)H-dependent oxidoreductase [Spirochaetota bacterium]|nr:NAD(P)H-dependent oxidoreductase [Spirochaetota bacterium]HPC41918.1 NAD(P)H-dependent oxidoreductase [Spirochaetota bacterium]HPL17354.1 NAD(P)H-dependent oxidoreductase [Spirochaetota bacterium]HQF09628.1 NAD(P)H-dependent oxidoreductase [Spirochaetota bacterium]HQH98302.1 NAD(P)H-dependent oxidoreductase [Spirochaetota bacterium]
MRLLICNGSPRGKGSNTALLLKHFTDGFSAYSENSFETAYLMRTKEHAAIAEKARRAQAVIIAFPLYADSMPGIVKEFIETLGAPPPKGRAKKQREFPPMGFIVQSGFPEAVHSRCVERYLEKLARRLNARYIGTVIKGGVEGIQDRPAYFNRRLFMAFRSLGRHFGVTKEFHPITMKKLAGLERFSAVSKFFFRLLATAGLFDSGWNKILKQNGAYERRFDRPYQP